MSTVIATIVGHYPFFFVYNFLGESLQPPGNVTTSGGGSSLMSRVSMAELMITDTIRALAEVIRKLLTLDFKLQDISVSGMVASANQLVFSSSEKLQLDLDLLAISSNIWMSISKHPIWQHKVNTVHIMHIYVGEYGYISFMVMLILFAFIDA